MNEWTVEQTQGDFHSLTMENWLQKLMTNLLWEIHKVQGFKQNMKEKKLNELDIFLEKFWNQMSPH